MTKVINISSNGIKQAIDDLVNENELLQDRLYKQQDEIERLSKEVDMWNRKYNEQIDIINELEKSIQKEIERTNNIILEDSSMIEINNIRKMLNEDRQRWLFELKKLKEGVNND